jgi:hypothetical protein
VTFFLQPCPCFWPVMVRLTVRQNGAWVQYGLATTAIGNASQKVAGNT